MNSHDAFVRRHIGVSQADLPAMVEEIGVDSLDALIDQVVPAAIRTQKELKLPPALTEHQYLSFIKGVAKKNSLHKSFIGYGYYGCITPSVILRNIFENPGWYTQYTPYQAEIAQGRLEALLNFQTVVSDLTGMDVANASLLDEGTAAAEAMSMLHRIRAKSAEDDANAFFISETLFAQTIDVLISRAEPLGIDLVIGDHDSINLDGRFFGAIIQYPAEDGNLVDISSFIQAAHKKDIRVVVASDLLALVLLTPPGELGADVVVGSSQRFGVPLGYGGPHAAFFAAREEYVRQVPGRIIGVSHDKSGSLAYRMALQTREQHIRREKATSNICTAQALLAIMAGMYAVYHGPEGLKAIARRIHGLACMLSAELKNLGYRQTNDHFFDTITVDLSAGPATMLALQTIAQEGGVNFRYADQKVGISLDETTEPADVEMIVEIFARATNRLNLGIKKTSPEQVELKIPQKLQRKTPFLTHPVFHSHHSETKMMRYIKKLENKDLSLTTSMISLGSCTMKLNAATEMIPLSWAEFADLHPFIPLEQATGYQQVFEELSQYLNEITGFAATSLQPNSGAQGEFTSLSVISAYHRDRGQGHRNVVLIPASAHGTNPASAVMAGMQVVIVKCDEGGNIDLADLKEKANLHRENLAAIMVTYPSTHGVFEEEIMQVCRIVHENGGQVFMDGANMNAQVGLTSPAAVGADICHLNLHKTFSIPHGGGGPGMGPISAATHLADYLPGHPLIQTGGVKAIHAVSSAPWGSPSILLISYAYIKMLGADGLTEASKHAIINANYIKSRLEKHYDVLYKGVNGFVAHELIFDLRPFKEFHIEAEDIAKRLMDYGFHAPTVSWPVPGTMMVEPTESESKDELDRFCDALIEIHKEIDEIKAGTVDINDNALRQSPHTAQEVTADEWTHPYSRQKAAYPLAYVKENKFWPSVGRIDNTYGDRNLVCSCPPVEAYQSEE
jgi:glycine dehydrogenase